MLTTRQIVTDCPLLNGSNSKGFTSTTRAFSLNRKTILNNYSQEILDACWEALSINVIQNYQRGKGTYIKGFGTFTFKGQDVNLEGTTNQYIRDKKPKQAVFIVSKDFNEEFKAGEYTRQNGIRYYHQKDNKNISIVKLNLAEIAYSLSISKDEAGNILKHTIKYISESLSTKNITNKTMPGLGVLVSKGNIIAVRFDDEFRINNSQNQKLTFLKKNISLDMNMDKAQYVMANDCTKPYQMSEELKAKKSLYTNVEESAKNYLMNQYNINVESFPEKAKRNIYNKIQSNTPQLNILNEKQKNNNIKVNNNNENDQNKPLLLLDEETLNAFEYFKGNMLNLSKNYDINKKGGITKEEAINVLLKSNISNSIDYNVAKSIVEYYNKTDNIDYMKFIAQLIKDCRLTSIKKTGNKKVINNQNGLYESFKRENYFDDKNNKNKKVLSTSVNFYNKKSIMKKKSENNTDHNTINSKEEDSKVNNNEKQNLRYNSENRSKNITQINFFSGRQKETEESKKKLATIVGLIGNLKVKYATTLDQKISFVEFMNILHQYDVFYPAHEIESLLNFLGIPNLKSFSLREFLAYIKSCKIIQTSISLDELNKILKKLKDIIYVNGGSKFLFINNKTSIDCDTFINILKDKVPYSKETLVNVYRYLVKTDRNFTMDDYKNYFDNPAEKVVFDNPYFLQMMKTIIILINNKHLKAEEYFDHLLLYNVSTQDKLLTRLNWIKYLKEYEKLAFSAEELDNLFNWIDTKKDNVIDREEFLDKYNYSVKPLTIVQDIVNCNKLDIEDLAHRMKINMYELEKYDYPTFASKLKKLNYTFPDEFILKIFNELKKKNEGSGETQNYVESKKFLDEINYVKPPENYKSFTQNYMNTIKSKIGYEDLKKILEKYDDDSLGKLTKLQYVSAVSNILPEFNDDDHMRFIRVTNMFDSHGRVLYPEVLNLIYYFNKSKLSDPFTKMCQTLIEKLKDECNDDVENLMYLIDCGIPKKATSLTVHKPLSATQVKNYLDKLNLNISIPIKIIQKLDIDADGQISFDDLKAVLKRYSGTLYFKYVNDSNNPNINLYSKENMTERKIKTICIKLQTYMKSKNISEAGLFRKFDKDNDGFISNIDFNQGIQEMLKMSPALGDPFFNYLDFYHCGMIDLETFTSRLNNFITTHVIVQNDNKIENEIINKMKEFVLKNKNLSDNEIFQVIDKDCDGLISIDDFQQFVTDNLLIFNIQFNKPKLERVMMSLSLSKNLQIGLNDIREFIDLCNENKQRMNLKEIFKLTTNQNLSKLKKNVEWTNDIIERLGMFVSEKYDSIEQFFKENSEPGSNKFKFSDFLKFHEKNYELFNNGFNLTKDELLSIYSSLDSQKKNFLTLQDLQNKLQIFNFYTKMHIDVKHFLQENFSNSVDAFKFFIEIDFENNKEMNEPNYISEKNALKCSITLKEFFDAFNSFFPNKYANGTIMKYLNKYFNISLSTGKTKNELLNKKDTISYSEFSYIYFDKVSNDETFINQRSNDTKLMTNRFEIAKKFQKKVNEKSENNFYYSHLFKKKFENLSTPFDNDPLLKIKRIICSTKFNLNKFFETAALECKNDSFIINKYQFRNIIKSLNIGMTNLEIDQIIEKIGKVSYDGNINLREFVKYLYNQNNTLKLGKENIAKIVEEIKSLIYKYYSNPIICFQNNDKNHVGKIDFEQFKNIILDMYYRNEQPFPNFTIIKNAFDACDLRKDGIIDINEWCKTFASYNGKYDVFAENVSNDLEFFDSKFKTVNNFENRSPVAHNRKILREWETSTDVAKILKFIHKNKRAINNKLKTSGFLIESIKGGNCVNPENLLLVLKEMLPEEKMSQTQWKMIINIGRSQIFEALINIDEFFRLIEITSINYDRHPNVKNNNRLSRSVANRKYCIQVDNNNSYNNFNGVGYKTSLNGFSMDRRNNTIIREMKPMNSFNGNDQNSYLRLKAVE